MQTCKICKKGFITETDQMLRIERVLDKKLEYTIVKVFCSNALCDYNEEKVINQKLLKQY